MDACRPLGTGVRFVTTDDDAVLDPTPPSPPARGSRSVPDPQATPPLAPIHLLAAAPDEVPLYRRPTGSERPWLPYQDGYDLQTYECPVSAPPGRYLWVELALHGTGRSSPRVRALRVERPGHALLGALPRSWSRVEEDASFLFRLLAPAEGMLHDLDEWAAARAVMVNPQGAPSAALDWLAGLAGLVLDQRWPQEAQRTLIAEAYSLFRGRGTRQALIRTLAIYLGYERPWWRKLREWPEPSGYPARLHCRRLSTGRRRRGPGPVRDRRSPTETTRRHSASLQAGVRGS
jgi:phage tail-like protein